MKTIIKKLKPRENTLAFNIKREIVFPNISNYQLHVDHSVSSSLKINDRVILYPVRNFFDSVYYKNRIATLCFIQHLEHNSKCMLTLKGTERVRLISIKNNHRASYTHTAYGNTFSDRNLLTEFKKRAQELIFLINSEISTNLIKTLNYIDNLDTICDFISHYFIFNFTDKYDLYQEIDVALRCKKLLDHLDTMIIRLKKRGQVHEKKGP